MEYNNYHFDIADDGDDSNDSTNEQLNEYYLHGHLDMILNEQYCQDDMDTHSAQQQQQQQEKEEEEENLSQKLSQLSTKSSNKRRLNTPSSSPDAIPKKIKFASTTNENETDGTSNELANDLAKTPVNLAQTNTSFIHLTQQILNQTASSMNLADIQQLALLIYRIALLRIHKQITMTYLKSGTGILCEAEPELDPVDRRVWPAVIQQAASQTKPSNSQDQQLIYEELIYERLQQLNHKVLFYQQEFDEKKNCLNGFTPAMQQMIEEYVHHMVIMPFKLKRDMKIESIKFDFNVEINKRKFLRENPNQYQIDIAKRIYVARDNYERIERQMTELKQRLIYNKPILSLEQQLLKLENEYYTHKKIYHSEVSTMWSNHRNLIRNKDMPTELSKLIDQHDKQIAELWQKRFDFRFQYYLIYPFGDSDEQQISLQPYIYSDMTTSVTHLFNQQQLKFLSRGPTYVPPCQNHVTSSSSSTSSLDDIVRKLYAPLKHQLAYVFNKYKITVNQQFVIENEIFEQFKRCFSTSLPSDLQKRALYEKHLLKSIYQTLQNHQLILRRTADNLNTFYLGHRPDFEVKADKYLEETTGNIYELVHMSSRENFQREHLSRTRKTSDYINNALRILQRRKDITSEVFNRLYMNWESVKVSCLTFLPEITDVSNIKLVPFINSSPGHLTYKLSQYVDELLRPFAYEYMKPDVFQDDLDFIQRFHTYKTNSNTLLCTIKILNYSTLDTHENMIATVTGFIQDNVAANRLGKILISTIKNLLQLCLYHTMFSYKNKLYKFLKGGPTTLPLMDTLSNIYLYVWQQKILHEIKEKNEFVGRYKDELFFTWHKTHEDFNQFIEKIRKHFSHLNIQTSIGCTVQCVNATISIEGCRIKSSVYHNPDKQIYALPYVIGHPKIQYSNWIRSALIRAVCYCSSVEDFNRERIRIELAMYANGYSHEFIENRIQHFYDYFLVVSLRYDLNQTTYDKWREKWFKFVDTRRQQLNEIRHRKDQNDLLRFFYLHEYGKRCDFNRQFQLLWLKHFHQHPILGKNPMIVLLFTKHLHSLNTLLAQI